MLTDILLVLERHLTKPNGESYLTWAERTRLAVELEQTLIARYNYTNVIPFPRKGD